MVIQRELTLEGAVQVRSVRSFNRCDHFKARSPAVLQFIYSIEVLCLAIPKKDVPGSPKVQCQCAMKVSLALQWIDQRV